MIKVEFTSKIGVKSSWNETTDLTWVESKDCGWLTTLLCISFCFKERNEVSNGTTTTMYYFTLILCMYLRMNIAMMLENPLWGSRSKLLKIEEDSFCCLTYCCYLGCNFFFKAIRAWNLWRPEMMVFITFTSIRY